MRENKQSIYVTWNIAGQYSSKLPSQFPFRLKMRNYVYRGGGKLKEETALVGGSPTRSVWYFVLFFALVLFKFNIVFLINIIDFFIRTTSILRVI